MADAVLGRWVDSRGAGDTGGESAVAILAVAKR